jgi:exodeoxyribonuclease VII small subunit
MSEKSAPIEDFERSLAELEALVARMEQGQLSLDEMVKSFERGMSAYQTCQSALEQAQLRVDLMLKQGQQVEKQSFDPETP